jgi:hypothetical protein
MIGHAGAGYIKRSAVVNARSHKGQANRNVDTVIHTEVLDRY